MKDQITVAAVDFVPAWGSVQTNISNLVQAVEKVAQQGVDFAVFPETAQSGYLFTDSEELAPFLDTIPGKTTDAILPLLKKYNMYMSVGIAEKDAQTNIPYNSAVLMGPEGIIGTYRKIGLNSQDRKVFGPGNTGINVFDTPIGKIALLICYDDTYWQYARIAMLKGAQIIAWHSVSDRVMPNASVKEKLGDHSTVAHVQHMSALNGVWVIGATRSGIETNPNNNSQVYYNGGSSIWNPSGEKIAQAPVIGPIVLPNGLHGIYTAQIDVSKADTARERILKRRRPHLYNPLLALHRVPTDANASTTVVETSLKAIQWTKSQTKLSSIEVQKQELVVLPEFAGFEYTDDPTIIKSKAESKDGPFEKQLCQIALKGQAFIVGSYPEVDNGKYYHTIVLGDPSGKIISRYRVTHLNERDAKWASSGEEMVVTPTSIGRIALAAAYELEISEVGGMLCALRADVLAAPAGLPSTLKVQIDKDLYSIANPPTGKADYFSYAAATLNQMWVVCGGRYDNEFTSCGIYGPEPVVFTPTLLAEKQKETVQSICQIPAPYTWINQDQLIAGQAAIWFPIIVK
ncbi:nitrilase-related carbon-nitrogen hydrolase [Myroides sp. LJL115]